MLATPFGLTVPSPAVSPGVTPSVVDFRLLKYEPVTTFETATFPLTGMTGNIAVIFYVVSTALAPGAGGIDSVVWNGDPLTEVLDDGWPQNGGSYGWAGWIRGGSTDGDLVVNAVTAGQYADLIGWAVNLDQLAVSPIGDSTINPVRVSQGAHTVDLTVVNAASRLLSLVGCGRNGMYPMALSSGWSIIDATRRTGSAAAVMGHRVAGATGSVPMTATGPVGIVDGDWLGAALELLPA